MSLFNNITILLNNNNNSNINIITNKMNINNNNIINIILLLYQLTLYIKRENFTLNFWSVTITKSSWVAITILNADGTLQNSMKSQIQMKGGDTRIEGFLWRERGR